MMQQHTIHIAGGVVRNPLVRLTEPVTLDFLAGEHIAIVGPNGAGKSLLVDMLTGKYPLRDGELTYDFSPSLTKTAYDNIKYIAFRDTYGSADANYYYQQRWNAHDQEDAPLVREVLGEVKDDALRRQLFELFSIEPMLDKKIILLSSGELRKFQLTKALLTVPRILIMDNPFIGLDAPTRELLFNLLDRLTRLGELQIVLVLSMLDDIPSFVTHVVPVEEMKVGEKMEREEYVQAFCAGNQMRIQEEAGALEELQRRILDLPYEHANFTSDEVVKLNGVSIRYDDRTILKELDWTVMRGEKWALSGENGAGKSTLLSLVCADTFAREVFNGLDTFCNARHLHYDMRIQGCQFFTLFNHAFIVGGYHLGTYIALHNITDVHIVLTLVLHSFDTFFCHKRRISGNSVEYAQVIGLPNLFQICRINKKLHDINV